MKNVFSTAFKAGVVAIALTLAQSSYAASISAASATKYFSTESTIFGSPAYTIEPWTVHDGSTDLLAFCIDPFVAGNTGINTYAGAEYVAIDDIKKLYESSYALVNAGGYNADKAASFQLALWSITNPGGIVLSTTGGYLPYEGYDSIAADALSMLTAASTYGGTLTHYSYTTWTADNSQTLLSVSAVPEAETWGMLVAGLGLMGVVARRKSAKGEKTCA